MDARCATEAKQYGVAFDRHDRRYDRTAEWLAVVDGMWREPSFSFEGEFQTVEGAVLEPKPLRAPRPTVYAGGEADVAKRLISERCDAWHMHGDPPETIRAKLEEMERFAEEVVPLVRSATRAADGDHGAARVPGPARAAG